MQVTCGNCGAVLTISDPSADAGPAIIVACSECLGDRKPGEEFKTVVTNPAYDGGEK